MKAKPQKPMFYQGLTLGQLREFMRQIDKYPNNTPIICSSDPEGNNYAPMGTVEGMTDKEFLEFDDRPDLLCGKSNVVCIWPF